MFIVDTVHGFTIVCTAVCLFFIPIFCIVGNAPAPLEVRTCHAAPTVHDCTAQVHVVPQNIGAYAVRVETPVHPSATATSVHPGL